MKSNQNQKQSLNIKSNIKVGINKHTQIRMPEFLQPAHTHSKNVILFHVK